MRRVFTLLATLLMTFGVVGVASAASHGHPWPEHGHVLLLHVEYDGGQPVSYGKCIDIANNNTNDHAHHGTIHTGRAAQALQRAGHLVVPTVGLSPTATWADCEGLAQAFGPPR
jgi:hypothetical protein